jgi:uridylate kinase
MKKKIVLKVGGSLLFSKSKEIKEKKIKKICNIIENNNNYDQIIIIIGGGKIARQYIHTIRNFKKNEAFCDLVGIKISRLNCLLFISKLSGKVYPNVPKTFKELSTALLFKKIIVMGGIQPGQSTTSVSIEVAEFIDADKIIILTDVEGIYDKDPSQFKDAKLFERLTYKELENLIIKSSTAKQANAGEYRIFDAVSLQLLKRSSIPIHIISGKDLNNLRSLLNEESQDFGTIIQK